MPPGYGPPDAGQDPEQEQDAAFAALVARFDDEPGPSTWPTAEDVPSPPRPTLMPVHPIRRPPEHPVHRCDHVPYPDEETGTRDEPDDSEPDDSDDEPSDHYDPPPPPSIPRMQPVTRWALCSIALGVAILLAPSVAGIEHGSSRDVAGVMLVLGGVATLVARMGDRLPTDSDDDDGAVV